MKKLLFMAIMASSTLLCAFSNEEIRDCKSNSQMNTEAVSAFSLNDLESRRPCHRRHRQSSSYETNNERCVESEVNLDCCANILVGDYGSFYTTATLVVETQEPVDASSTPAKTSIKKKKGPLLINPAIIDAGFPLILDQTSAATNNVSLLPDGSVLIARAGDYKVSFGASIDRSEDDPALIGLALNGVLIPDTSFEIFQEQYLVKYTTTISVPNAPAVLTIINAGDEGFALSTLAEESVTAFITLNRLP